MQAVLNCSRDVNPFETDTTKTECDYLNGWIKKKKNGHIPDTIIHEDGM